jgi:hypothetical protein
MHNNGFVWRIGRLAYLKKQVDFLDLDFGNSGSWYRIIGRLCWKESPSNKIIQKNIVCNGDVVAGDLIQPGKGKTPPAMLFVDDLSDISKSVNDRFPDQKISRTNRGSMHGKEPVKLLMVEELPEGAYAKYAKHSKYADDDEFGKDDEGRITRKDTEKQTCKATGKLLEKSDWMMDRNTKNCPILETDDEGRKKASAGKL